MIVRNSERLGNIRLFTERQRDGSVIKIVYRDYIPIARFNPDNINERRLAVVELVEEGHCTQVNAGKICGFHRNTVFKLLRTKRILGIEAIFEDNRGPKGPYKYIGTVRTHIKKMLRKYPELKDQEIADKASEYLDMEISRNAVARIRIEKQSLQAGKRSLNKKELMALATLADSFDREKFDTHQMELNFKFDKDISETIDLCRKETLPESKLKTNRKFIDKLQRGQRLNVAGTLMHHLFLQEIDFRALTRNLPLIPGCMYQSRDILLTLFHSINLGVPSIEALKLVNAEELGLCMGTEKAPDKETVRTHLARLAEHYPSCDLIDLFARALLKRRFIDPEVFFIDGHFLPYYGLNVIAKGYFTVRRLAMPGNELYAITDLKGRPLFFITESNEIDFRPIISRSAKKLKSYGIERPIMVFDRGGYGVHFFKELDQTADFVTWAKYVGDKALSGIPDTDFTMGMRFGGHKYLLATQNRTVKESVQTAKNEGRSTPTAMDVRMVVLENIDTGKRIGIFTNNKNKSISDIAYYMLNRWGDSENVFKEMMARFNLNYHPGYDIKELENQPLIDNPDIHLIKKAVRILHKEIKALEEQILLIEAKQQKRPDKRRLSKLDKYRKSIVQKQDDITRFEEKLSQLPDKVSIIEILKGKSMNRCDLEKKKLYDLMQFMAYNSRERLVEIFRTCYDDHRDVKPVLDMITHRAGYVKLVGQTLLVVLDWIHNRKHRDAAEAFCRLLNRMDIKMTGRLELKLAFYISKYPMQGVIPAESP